MRAITNRIGNFLVTNTVWIFLTAIVFISFNWVMTFFHQEIGSLVYLVQSKWYLFGQFTIQLIIIFLPVLLFSASRNWLQDKFDKKVYHFLWGYSFILHPILITVLEFNQLFAALTFESEILLIIGGILFLLEFMIGVNDYFFGKIGLSNLFRKVNLENILLIGIILISLIMSIIGTYITISNGNNKYSILISFLSAFGQVLLFQIVIYSFYLVNHYLLIEKVFKQKGLFFYTFAFIGTALLFYPFFALCIYYLPLVTFQWFLSPESWIPIGERIEPFQAVPSHIPWIWMALSIPLILVFQWWKQQNDITQLEKEKSNAELNALKQQINPHFLFNTLNSLYALSIEENSDKTADGIAKLGTLMRYNLNDAQKEFIPLQKEIDYIQKYIELQKLRLTVNNQLTVQLPAEKIDQFQIAPLLLIPFIENVFKFGVSSTEKTKIVVNVSLENNRLILHLFNTITKNREDKDGNGIGISNTRKRLAKLYPEKYELIVEEPAAEFEVHLEVDL